MTVSRDDVARHVGVSPGTVSRVVNGHPSVQPVIRRAVLQAIEELGYVPNAAALGLRQSRTRTIGLVVSTLLNSTILETVAGIGQVVDEHGYSLVLCDSRGRLKNEGANLKTLMGRRVEGLILFPVSYYGGEELALFLNARIPVVLGAFGPAPKYRDVPALPVLGLRTKRVDAEYLVGLGHRRIAVVTWETPSVAPLRKAWREQFRTLGLSFDDSLLVPTRPGTACVQAVASLLSSRDRPTALIAPQPMAPDALLALYEEGLTVPQDISFICLDDSRWAIAHRPPITTLRHDTRARGRQAAEYIFARISGQPGEALLRPADYELVVRESCAPPP